MREFLHFDDIALLPRFSEVNSRKDVDISTRLAGQSLQLPIIGSNMDTVMSPKMAHALDAVGAVGCLHRFQDTQQNVAQYHKSPSTTWGSFGLGKAELDRAYALAEVGVPVLVLDVAHGASQAVVQQVKRVREFIHPSIALVVGNFATGQSIKDFLYHLGNNNDVDTFKVGIGTGSACTTTSVTGVGLPIFGSLQDCAAAGVDLICDGGVRNSGDLAKALIYAKAVMMGRVLAGTEESPSEFIRKVKMHSGREIQTNRPDFTDEELLQDVAALRAFHESHELPVEVVKYKKYRGSASLESYQVQGKVADHRTAEGQAYLIPYTGTVKDTLQPFEAGLRSTLSYAGAFNLEQYQENVEFVRVTGAGASHAGAFGKNL